MGWILLWGSVVLLFPAIVIAGNAREYHHQVLAIPETGAYTGVCFDSGGKDDHVTRAAIEKFEKRAGKHQAVIAYEDSWGEQHFSEKTARAITEYGAVPLIFWSPWDKPYTTGRIPDKFNLYNILGGMWDDYIDQWAEAAKNFGNPLLVSWGFEMNDDRFPWSVYYYGGGQDDFTQKASGYFGPELFKQAYRYVVNRVRAKGVHNIQWVFQVASDAYPSGRWNRYVVYYPGSKYVDWLGLSFYENSPGVAHGDTFYRMCKKPYDELRKMDPSKPVMIARWETGIYPAAKNKPLWLQKAFADLKEHFPRIKMAVYRHERIKSKNAPNDNSRDGSSSEALKVYRQEMENSYWIGLPRYRTIK
jgi:hypothetical protein